MQIDHVLIAATSLTRAAETFAVRYGLDSVEGGRHSGWGTMNRIVPLGDTYLELVAVVDEVDASRCVFGRWVSRSAGEDGRLMGWAVRTDDVDGVCRRLDLAPLRGSRMGRDGTSIRWRLAGLEVAADDPTLPIFIEWEPGAAFPGRSGSAEAVTITQLALRGDAQRLSTWLGNHDLPISIEPGRPALLSVTLSGPQGTMVITDTLRRSARRPSPRARLGRGVERMGGR